MTLQDVFVHAELARTSKIDSDVRANGLLHLADPVVGRMRAIVNQLTLPQRLSLPGASMKRRDHRQQLEAIW